MQIMQEKLAGFRKSSAEVDFLFRRIRMDLAEVAMLGSGLIEADRHDGAIGSRRARRCLQTFLPMLVVDLCQLRVHWAQ